MPASPFHATGGSLPPNHATYVKRRSDDEFYQALKRGDYCYVLNSRQMGKSSLRSRTRQRLEARSATEPETAIVCATLDLSGDIDTESNENTWYYTLANLLGRQLGLLPQLNLWAWWSAQEPLAPKTRFSHFLRDVVLERIADAIVIFIDEIDTVLSLKQVKRDDFFALIRACYNQRDHDPAYHRLTFALFGVATPSDLIQDRERTPFNIGRAIQLTGFTPSEAEPLAQGLAQTIANPQAVLREVLHWTGGQPFLTQKVCDRVVRSVQLPEGEDLPLVNPEQVAAWVQQQIIEQWESKDDPEHLRTIQTRLLGKEQRANRLLGLYQEILHQGAIEADGSAAQVELRLTGLVVERQNRLEPYNPIYRQVFNPDWVSRSFAKVRPYFAALAAWEADRQNDRHLLRGADLANALAWAEDRTLGRADYQFLVESQKVGLRQELEAATRQLAEKSQELIDKTDALAQVEAQLAQAQTELEQSRWRTRRSSRIGAAVLATALVGTGFFSWQADQQRSIAADLKTDVADLKTDIEALEADTDSAVTERDQAIEEKQALEDSNQDLTRKTADLETQFDQATQAIETAQQQLDQSRSQLEATQKDLSNQQIELTNTTGKLETATGRLETANGELRDANEQINTQQENLRDVFPLTEAILDFANEDTQEQALTQLDQILADNSANTTVMIVRGEFLNRLDDHDAARADFDQAIALEPDNFVAYFGLGNTHRRQGNWDLAVAAYDQAIAKAKDNGETYPQAWMNRGVALTQRGELMAALASHNTAVGIDPSPDTLDNLEPTLDSFIENWLGSSTIQLDGIRTARTLGTVAGVEVEIQSISGLSRPRLEAADIQVVETSLELLERSKTDISHAEMSYYRGFVLLIADDNMAAIQQFGRALSLQAEFPEIYILRGAAYSNQGDLAEAIADFDRAIELNRQNALAYNNRGGARYLLEDVEGAIADFDQAIELNPKNVLTYYNRGIAR